MQHVFANANLNIFNIYYNLMKFVFYTHTKCLTENPLFFIKFNKYFNHLHFVSLYSLTFNLTNSNFVSFILINVDENC